MGGVRAALAEPSLMAPPFHLTQVRNAPELYDFFTTHILDRFF